MWFSVLLYLKMNYIADLDETRVNTLRTGILQADYYQDEELSDLYMGYVFRNSDHTFTNRMNEIRNLLQMLVATYNMVEQQFSWIENFSWIANNSNPHGPIPVPRPNDE